MRLSVKKISIVVTSYSLARFGDVKDIALSVFDQTYPNVELVLVIEGSELLRDAVISFVNDCKAYPTPNMKIIFIAENVGLSAARNAGFEASSGDLIAFVDDDVVLESDWAEEVVGAYDDPTVIGTTGYSKPMWIGRSLNWLPTEFYWLIGSSAFAEFKTVTEVRNAWGWGMSFSREVFDKGCRFKISYGYRAGSKEAWGQRPPEDVDFSLIAKEITGGRIVFVPSARLMHKVFPYRFTMRLIAEKAFFSGRQRRMIQRSYRNIDSLSMEKGLVRRILVNTFPNIMKRLFRKPFEAWQQLSVSLVIIFLVFIGFYTK